MKKILSLTLAAVLLLGLFGCSQESLPPDNCPSDTETSGIGDTTAPPETTGWTEDTQSPETTAAEPTDATDETEATQSTEAAEVQEKQQETAKEQPSQETKPTATEPTQPTVTEQTQPPVTEPIETLPPQTEPPETQLPETTPTETEPPTTEPPSTEPATEATEPETYEITEDFKRQVAQYAIQYLNQYRAETGVQACTYLPGMTLVAEYRADQLTWNFSHSTADKRAALAYYQYGRYVDATLAGLSENDSYYEADSAEAICAGFKGVDAEALGKYIAKQIRNSGSHWSYIGSSEYSYIGVGVEYREGSEYGWYACVMVGRVNYG